MASAQEQGEAPGNDSDRLTDFESVTGAGVTGRVAGRRVLVGKEDLLEQAGVARPDELFTAAQQWQGAGPGPWVWVAVDGQAAGILAVADPVKTTSAEAVRSLQSLGIRVAMLTGDQEATARAVGPGAGD